MVCVYSPRARRELPPSLAFTEKGLDVEIIVHGNAGQAHIGAAWRCKGARVKTVFPKACWIETANDPKAIDHDAAKTRILHTTSSRLNF
jgi:hypothetical protein